MGLERAFYDRDVVEVAHDLVGCVLAYGDAAGVIVETEAYHMSEPACHAYVGLTARTATLFGPPGTAYVYRSYGIHALLNAVCDREDVGAAVLVRALEPLAGVEAMRLRRPGIARDVDLTNGPGKLTQALGIGLSLNASSLVCGPIAVGLGMDPVSVVRSAPRIGITQGSELDWRFSVRDNAYVSRPWPERRKRGAGRSTVRRHLGCGPPP